MQNCFIKRTFISGSDIFITVLLTRESWTNWKINGFSWIHQKTEISGQTASLVSGETGEWQRMTAETSLLSVPGTDWNTGNSTEESWKLKVILLQRRVLRGTLSLGILTRGASAKTNKQKTVSAREGKGENFWNVTKTFCMKVRSAKEKTLLES